MFIGLRGTTGLACHQPSRTTVARAPPAVAHIINITGHLQRLTASTGEMIAPLGSGRQGVADDWVSVACNGLCFSWVRYVWPHLWVASWHPREPRRASLKYKHPSQFLDPPRKPKLNGRRRIPVYLLELLLELRYPCAGFYVPGWAGKSWQVSMTCATCTGSQARKVQASRWR